jgi:hypothetical protein
MRRMRWDDLFADLEAQWDAEQAAELAGEVAERTRSELARVRLADRLRGSVGRSVTVSTSPERVAGRLASSGPDWLLVDDGRAQVLVPLSAVSEVTGLGAQASAPDAVGVVESRLDLGFALRRLARDRQPLRLVLTDGSRLTGTVDRVGADFLDLAEHDTDEPRRPASVRALRTVSFVALATIRPV